MPSRRTRHGRREKRLAVGGFVLLTLACCGPLTVALSTGHTSRDAILATLGAGAWPFVVVLGWIEYRPGPDDDFDW